MIRWELQQKLNQRLKNEIHFAVSERLQRQVANIGVGRNQWCAHCIQAYPMSDTPVEAFAGELGEKRKEQIRSELPKKECKKDSSVKPALSKWSITTTEEHSFNIFFKKNRVTDFLRLPLSLPQVANSPSQRDLQALTTTKHYGVPH